MERVLFSTDIWLKYEKNLTVPWRQWKWQWKSYAVNKEEKGKNQQKMGKKYFMAHTKLFLLKAVLIFMDQVFSCSFRGRGGNTLTVVKSFNCFLKKIFTFCSRETRSLEITIARSVNITLFISPTLNFPLDHNVFEFLWVTLWPDYFWSLQKFQVECPLRITNFIFLLYWVVLIRNTHKTYRPTFKNGFFILKKP